MFLLSPSNQNLVKTKSLYDVVDDFFNNNLYSMNNHVFKIDVKENKDAFMIEAELPGIKREEIKLEYNDEHLVIAVQKEDKIDDEKENYIHRERRMSSMTRSLYLKDVEADGIEAKLEEGILKILAPKKENASNRLQIEVK